MTRSLSLATSLLSPFNHLTNQRNVVGSSTTLTSTTVVGLQLQMILRKALSSLTTSKRLACRQTPVKNLGLNFQSPRVQILLRSPLMVEETGGMRQVIGTFDDDEVKAIFDNDKLASELASSKGEMRKRHYAVRTKYLIYLLTKDNKRAHKIPMVLTIKGLNGTDLSEKIRMYEKEMSKCLSKALDTEVPMQYNEQFYTTTISVLSCQVTCVVPTA